MSLFCSVPFLFGTILDSSEGEVGGLYVCILPMPAVSLDRFSLAKVDGAIGTVEQMKKLDWQLRHTAIWLGSAKRKRGRVKTTW